MANATATATVTTQWTDGRYIHAIGTIAISAAADVYVTGGLTLSFAGKVQSSRSPIYVIIQGGTTAVGMAGYTFLAGTTIANGKILVFIEATVATNTPLAEHTAAAVAAGVSGDTNIRFHAIFPKQ